MKNNKSETKNILMIVGLVVIAFLAFWTWRNWETSLIYLEEVHVGHTGSEVCYEVGMSCLSVTTARITDADDQFYGFITPNCDSQVIEDSSCVDGHGTNYAIDNVTYRKSPNATSDEFFTRDSFCLSSKEGKRGIYQYAYCVKK